MTVTTAVTRLDPAEAHFDVSTHRCVFYGKFSQFAKDLEELIRGIEASEQTVEP